MEQSGHEAASAPASRRGIQRLTPQIVAGLLLGIGCGLFFGEYCAFLGFLGAAFTGLLQMTVLPYIVVALVAGIGSLSLAQGRRLAVWAVLVMVLLWGVGLLSVPLMVTAFPQRETGSFYSRSLSEPPPEIDLYELFVPANPFHSLAESLVPAVVVFSICLGTAVMGMPGKERLLELLNFLAKALQRINAFVIRFTPLGVFAIAAHASGTMSFEEIGRLQAYAVTYTLLVLLLAFVALPLLVSACTPLRFREVVGVAKEALLMAFATGKTIVALPILVERTSKLFEAKGLGGSEMRAEVEALYPLAYPFPHLGKLSSLLFIPFVAWFVGRPLEAMDYPGLLSLGLVAQFGGPLLALPFLLDVYRLPADTFQLFIAFGVYGGRLGDLLAVMHLLAFSLLATCGVMGRLRIQWPQLTGGLLGTFILGMVLIGGTRIYLARSFAGAYQREDIVSGMQLLMHPTPAVVHDGLPLPRAPEFRALPALERIRASGVLRVGFILDQPFAFFNRSGELVGYDIDMAHLLAQELDCELEFVPLDFEDLDRHLNSRLVDIVMSGVPMTTTNLQQVRMSEPYLNVTLAFAVRDDRRREFQSLANLARRPHLRVGIVRDNYFRKHLVRSLPNVEVVEVRSPREFFEDENGELDALVISAEGGSAWTFAYPQFEIVVPQPDAPSQPLAYPCAVDDEQFAQFISRWIDLKTKRGDKKPIYEHWILGIDPRSKPARWSVLRNVLGWVE